MREAVRSDAGAFAAEIPDDVLDRVLLNSDEIAGRKALARRMVPVADLEWLRHEAAAESGWPVLKNTLANVEAGNAALIGSHPPKPSTRLKDYPGLAVGSHAAAGEHKLQLEDLGRAIAERELPIVEHGGMVIALRKSDGRSKRARR